MHVYRIGRTVHVPVQSICVEHNARMPIALISLSIHVLPLLIIALEFRNHKIEMRRLFIFFFFEKKKTKKMRLFSLVFVHLCSGPGFVNRYQTNDYSTLAVPLDKDFGLHDFLHRNKIDMYIVYKYESRIKLHMNPVDCQRLAFSLCVDD